MIELGKYNTLEIARKTSIGFYLSDEEEDVLLPISSAPDTLQVGDSIEVFVYGDNEGRPIATTQKPKATVGDFVFLTAKAVNEIGAFLDWGITKDLLVPFREQKNAMRVGGIYLVYIYVDESSDRIVATSKWSRFINKETPSDLQEEDHVKLLIAEKTDLGYKTIINNKYLGLLFANEVFELLELGDIKRGYIKQIRPDGKIDVSLQALGYEHIEDSKHKILRMLESNDGKILLGDKSSPEEIYRQLQMSKKAFKKTIGALYREKLIILEDDSITLK